MTQKHIITLLILLFSTNISCAQKQESIPQISVAELRKNPDKYHNKKVAISGYLKLQFEGRCLYENEQECIDKLYDQNLYVFIASDRNYGALKKKYNLKYVTIVSTFRKDRKGHFSMFFGGLMGIDTIEVKS
jgi:hypothetical protein